MPNLEEHQKELEQRIRERRDAFRCFQSPRGKKALKELERFCHVRHTTHIFGDPYATAVREGHRQVFLWIESHLSEEDQERARQYIAEMEG